MAQVEALRHVDAVATRMATRHAHEQHDGERRDEKTYREERNHWEYWELGLPSVKLDHGRLDTTPRHVHRPAAS